MRDRAADCAGGKVVRAVAQSALAGVAEALPVAELLADRRAPEPVPELMQVAQAAELAGVSVTTVRNWLSNGRLTLHRPPRQPMVAPSELVAVLAGPQRTVRRCPETMTGANLGMFGALARADR